MNIKDKILEMSCELFNQYGLKNVTVRLICNTLKISLGTFSYHFNDKNIIMKLLYEQMQKELFTAITIMPNSKPSIFLYLETHKKIFIIQEKYKFFYLNLFEIITNHSDIKELYLENIQKERLLAKKMIEFYISEKILKKNLSNDIIDRLINIGQILNNFWLLDNAIMPNRKDAFIHYMKICCGLLEPYLEKKPLIEYKKYFFDLEELTKNSLI